MSKIFIDTNIICYAFDKNEPEKRQKSREILENLLKSEEGYISTQEFINFSTKKMGYKKPDVLEFVKDLTALNVHENSVTTILEGLKISIKTQFSIWDSLILAAAKETDCEILYSEDLNAGQVVDGVKIVNPF